LWVVAVATAGRPSCSVFCSFVRE